MEGITRLPASLRVTSDDVMTMTFDVVNDTAAPLVLEFPSAQQYDIIIGQPLHAPVWRWSEDRMFAQGVTSRTLAPGEHWTIVERWRPTERGTLGVHMCLTSRSHIAESVRFVTLDDKS